MAFCSPECRDTPDVRRFNSKISKRGSCWRWMGSTNPQGYGWFAIGKTMRHAHRVALELHLGRRLSRFEFALHGCDNPTCCRVHPEHVHLGDAQMNTEEMLARGREVRARGAANASTKLTAAQVAEIRAERGRWAAAHPGRIRVEKGSQLSAAALGERYGVSDTSITAVIRGRTHRGLA